ncbi:hypothetical protein CIG11343_0367 [Campylobacter iguaniorum]|uniref:DUF5320 domain-containing protein n=1 Tax=Campylobacter iguaniorum TaxID=1244531 RepID=UPI0007C93376|nr:DUF5320 domain-containing protein [Campylobacter iguaniorum]ANE35450.1 hypothetical protein CIG11343_0367 [Campylobacter iguaniorum]
MKKVLFLVIMLILFSGCASSAQNVYISTSSPIFITQKLPGKNVFVNFNENEGNLTQIVKFELSKHGYQISSQELANIIIKGRTNYFRKSSSTKPRMDMGFGFGRSFRGRSAGFGYRDPFDNDFYNKEYYYDAQIALLIQIKDAQNYTTNLNLQSEKSQIDFSEEKTLLNFNEAIAKKIVEILKEY